MKMTDVITGLRAVKPELQRATTDAVEAFKSLKTLATDIAKVEGDLAKSVLMEKLELEVLRAKEAVTDLGILTNKVCEISDQYTRVLETEKSEEAKADDRQPCLPGLEPEGPVSTIVPTAQVARAEETK